MKEHKPTKTVHDTNSAPWIDGEVRYLIRKKYAALKKFHQNKTLERKRKLRASIQNIKYIVRSNNRQHLEKIVKSFKDNRPKKFWSYRKLFLGGQSAASAAISYNDVTAKEPTQKAELINKYFAPFSFR